MQKVRILTYHRIGIPRGGRSERLTVPPMRFRRQLDLLRALRMRFIDLDTTAKWLEGGDDSPGRALVLSFDDGYAELCEHALPLLLRRGIPAIVFLVAERRRDEWMDWGERGAFPLMDWPRIREFSQAGIEFGSHTLSHADLTRLEPSRLLTEVADSRRRIEDQLGRVVRHFCYPYGRHDERVVEAVREAGYRTACTTVRGAVRPDADPLRLPRLTVGKRMGLGRFWLRVGLRH
ncbi:MAG: polysaccharide deacetylase family protein [Myxococcota bacterium]